MLLILVGCAGLAVICTSN